MAEAIADFSHFFEVRLDLFDGPIDLLLHLVKQNELPIEKISLAQVASQYTDCLERARGFDLEVAGEYLVIAATLLSIKASVLLNEPVQLVPDEDGNLVDPHEQLLARLREAAVYKEGAQRLGEMKLLGVDVFAAPPALHLYGPEECVYGDHNPLLLGKAFKKLLEKAKQDPGVVISLQFASIVERMMSVLDTLKRCGGSARFEELIPDVTSRASVVASFVALLELCKRAIVHVLQEGEFEDIKIVLRSLEVDQSSFVSEFDDAPAAAAEATVNA